MVKRTIHVVALLLACVSADAATVGFYDQGFTQTPVVRTDYQSTTAGTATNPLQASGCHYGQNPCPVLRTIWPQSNYWAQNYPVDCIPGYTCPPHWWTLVMNNEPTDEDGNLGPPDASLPHYQPSTSIANIFSDIFADSFDGSGDVMGFVTLYGNDNFPGDTYWRAHLVLNSYGLNPVRGGIPYLGFGAFNGHGNGGPVAVLNAAGSPHVLQFKSRLWGVELPQPCCGPGTTQLQTVTVWLTLIATWGTHPKMIQVAIYHISRDPQHLEIPDPYLGAPSPQNSHVQWEWRYPQGAFYPGAIYASLKADDMGTFCGMQIPTLALDQDVSYSVDLQQLFECMNNHDLFDEPLPATPNIPVTGILWSIETTGIDGYSWVDVHDMRMAVSSGANAAPASRVLKTAVGHDPAPPRSVMIRRALQALAEKTRAH